MDLNKQSRISLSDRSIEQNKLFLKELYTTTKLEESRKWFDKLDCSVSAARQIDKSMNLELFLESFDTFKYCIISLQIGQPIQNQISYCARCAASDNTDKFVWIECPLTENNYDVVSNLFKKAFDQDIEPVEIS